MNTSVLIHTSFYSAHSEHAASCSVCLVKGTIHRPCCEQFHVGTIFFLVGKKVDSEVALVDSIAERM